MIVEGLGNGGPKCLFTCRQSVKASWTVTPPWISRAIAMRVCSPWTKGTIGGILPEPDKCGTTAASCLAWRASSPDVTDFHPKLLTASNS